MIGSAVARALRGAGLAVVGLIVVLASAGCGASSDASGEAASEALLRVKLDKSNPERLLRYHFGGYAAPGGRDPFASGLLEERGGHFFVNLDTLAAHHSGLGGRLRTASGNNALAWKELAGFLQETYYDVRPLPPTLDSLHAAASFQQKSEDWFTVEIDGVMTTARRRVYVPKAALRHALKSYHQNDEQLLYPVGTTLIGEHDQEGKRVETTVMRKREDGFWDFFTYDQRGRLAPRTSTPPRELKTPTQCVGCHLGTRLFEPEKSFPAEAPPGPHGPRALYVSDTLRDAEAVRFFDEHRKRSDEVLGLYNTLFVAKLRAQRRAGTIAPEDRRLLKQVGL